MWNFLIILFAIAFYCYRSPFFHKVNPGTYSVNLPAKFEGPLSTNTKLENIEKLHENVIHWPEAFALYNDKIYTGLGDGRIVEVTKQKITEVAHTGKTCAGQHEEHICGRPLGMAFSKTGLLYVADAYHGLYSVDIKTGKKNTILPPNTLVGDLPLTFLNNVALDEKEQALYITQSTTRWNISDVIISFIEHDVSGRLLKYDLKTKKVSILAKGLPFPNGVELTHDGSAILVALGMENKIVKYVIHGEKKGLQSVLPLVLPGEPDNISRSNRGTYWVGVENGRSQETLSLIDRLADQPLLRKIALFLHRIITTPIAAVIKLLPYEWANETAFELQTARILADHLKSYGMIVEFDDSGKILQSLHSPSGNVAHISDVLEHKGYLYLGSWRNRFIGRLKL